MRQPSCAVATPTSRSRSGTYDAQRLTDGNAGTGEHGNKCRELILSFAFPRSRVPGISLGEEGRQQPLLQIFLNFGEILDRVDGAPVRAGFVRAQSAFCRQARECRVLVVALIRKEWPALARQHMNAGGRP